MSASKSSLQEEASIGRVLKYTGIFGGVQGLYALISIVRNKITAVFLGRTGLGLIDNYSRTAELATASTNLGLAFSAVQHLARLNSVGHARAIRHYVLLVRSWTLLAATLGIVVTLLFAPLAAQIMQHDTSAWWHFAALVPIVACSTLTGGEMAVLKGLGRVKHIALISVLTAISTLVLTTIFYVGWGIRGILPALALSAIVQFAFTLRSSHRAEAYNVRLRSWRFLQRGRHMVQLGLAYALTGFVAAGGEWLVRIILLHFSPANATYTGLEAVGLYTAGFTLTVSYSRLLFMALDADYYPRLSAATQRTDSQNIAVNRQIVVLVHLATPTILLFAALLPFVVRLLYSSDFQASATMAHWALPYLFFKAISVPIGYIALAHARSRLYLAVEASYTLFFVLSMAVGYQLWGIAGAGAALSVADALYLLVAWGVYARKFDFSMQSSTLRHCIVQSFLLFGGWYAFSQPNLWLHYGLGGLFFAISVAYSSHFLLHSSGVLARLSSRLRKKS